MKTQDIEGLDLSRCIVGPDLVAEIDGERVTIWRRRGGGVELAGVYRGAAAAWAALDVDDMS
jgi:hypothetical protein